MEEEKILGVIPNARLKTGFIRWETYTLIATNSRLIAAKVRSDLIKEEGKKRAKESKEEGHGKFKQYLARAITGFTFADRYLEISPEEILSETKGNFSIYAKDVLATKIKEGYTDDDDNNKSPNTLVIKTSARKFAFSFSSDVSDARKLLSQIR